MRELLRFITCGSVDDGKSTLIGHILSLCKLLYVDQEQALIRGSKVGSRSGEIDYSLLLDGLMAEREQGITIDVAYRYFQTEARSFIVADTPGHEEYTRNMAVGASFADAAVILVDATKGLSTQTRRHAYICALMGIREFVFAVNKMDLVGFDEGVFKNILTAIEELRDERGLHHVHAIPISATRGDNLVKPSADLSWYQGLPLLGYLETVGIDRAYEDGNAASNGSELSGHDPGQGNPEAQEDAERGFCLPVQRVCRPHMDFRGFQGQIEAGSVQVGDRLVALPSGQEARVTDIHIGDRKAPRAVKGQPVNLRLDRELDISRGCVLCSDADLKVAQRFVATLLWMGDEPLNCGGDYWIKIGTKLLSATVAGIRYRVNIDNGEKLAASTLEKNGIGLCDIQLTEPAVLAEFKKYRVLGELIVIDRISHATAACGVIEEVAAQGDGARDAEARDAEVKGDGARDALVPKRGINTRLLHGAGNLPEAHGATLPAIHQVSAFAYDSAQQLEQVFDRRAPGFSYTRISNPTVLAFEKRMAALEGGADAYACASGMAAITLALLAILKAGDEIVAGGALFGGTLDLLANLEHLGIRTRYVGRATAEEIQAAITPETRVVFVEMIENPRLEVVDIEAVASVAHHHGIPLIVDNTTATPVLAQPLRLGADIVVHSSSKYISGSGNGISGVIVDGGSFVWDFESYPLLAEWRQLGRLAYSARLRQDVGRNVGACLAPLNAWLGCLGLETLGLRMERLCDNALALARALSANPAIQEVNYPGLADSPSRVLVDRQMHQGRAGAILTLRAGSRERAFALLDGLTLAKIASNIGDVRTLVIHPASTIYATSDRSVREAAGVFDDLIRVSVGLEDIDDLIADFARAIALMTTRANGRTSHD
ncbi:MAG: aminotransferase class V-fold PLP-dependent enzyme [Coriobacteriales bacterium]|jgi:sulfate adenylyltransferase subunit 1 (EFTu-like GTPase family)/O-acetylhomoserine/O-acetylserine sulfhydrylase-like pyridoxal-dependent enzyme|nr:aminotransferase class V-fold PLP-dependent enzyme [Coriobacteriales bacterium]